MVPDLGREPAMARVWGLDPEWGWVETVWWGPVAVAPDPGPGGMARAREWEEGS